MTPEEFGRLAPEAQATIRAGLLMQQLLADADSARTILPLVDKVAKKSNPAHITVEEQAQPFIDRALAAVDAKLAERDKKAQEEQAVASLQAQIDAAKANDGFTDEGVKNVLKLMQDKGIGDFDSAKKAYRYDNPDPSATPRGASDQMNWNTYESMGAGDQKPFFFPDGVPSITDSPEAWEREMALKYLRGDVALPTS